MPFPKVLALYEMQTALSRIWTRGTVSILYNGNYYTMYIATFFLKF